MGKIDALFAKPLFAGKAVKPLVDAPEHRVGGGHRGQGDAYSPEPLARRKHLRRREGRLGLSGAHGSLDEHETEACRVTGEPIGSALHRMGLRARREAEARSKVRVRIRKVRRLCPGGSNGERLPRRLAATPQRMEVDASGRIRKPCWGRYELLERKYVLVARHPVGHYHDTDDKARNRRG